MRNRAFTLIELLTVIAIIGILAAIMIPTIGKVRDSARSTTCLSNLRQIGTATKMYAEENKGFSPPTSTQLASYGGAPALWRYAYSTDWRNQTNSSKLDELPDNLWGTIFECPKAKSDPVGSTQNRSYGLNLWMQNTTSGDLLFPVPNPLGGTPATVNALKLSACERPTRTPLYGDSLRSSSFYGNFANPRHNGKANVCFVDGHVASVLMTPDMLASSPRHDFWRGAL
ncbi:prepilin-type N-terminal cleavage/methylation domain-containing protein [Opitutaceae bacterium TAV3]|nr:prepilin-type N-terminal cleavage/methylation domain-containing protein [Opitutaceae bacterium TAV3]